MEFLIFNDRRRVSGIFRGEIDMEIGDVDSLNDFVVDHSVAMGEYIAQIGSEYGGIVGRVDHDTEQSYTGFTWRGLLNQWILQPPEGYANYMVSGDINDILRTVTAKVLGGFFDVDEELCGIEADRYSFPSYCTVLEGLMGLCETYGCKLMIRNEIVDKKLRVVLSAKRREKKSLPSSAFEAKTTISNMGINHLICVGKEEHSPVVHLHIWPDGTIKQEAYYQGFAERQAVYECNKNNLTDMMEAGKTQLRKLCSYQKMEMKSYSVDADIGDFLIAKKDGMVAQEPVVRKIVTGKNGNYHVEVKTKGEK